LNVIGDITSSTDEGLERSRGSPPDVRQAARAEPRSAPSPAEPRMTGRPPGTSAAAGTARKSPSTNPTAAPQTNPAATRLPILDPTGSHSPRSRAWQATVQPRAGRGRGVSPRPR